MTNTADSIGSVRPQPGRPQDSETPGLAWDRFATNLASVLCEIDEDRFLVLSLRGAHRFVQFAGFGAGALRAEAVSHHYLEPASQLDAGQVDALRALGWRDPTHAPDAPEDQCVPSGSTNHFVDFQPPVDPAAVAALAVATLRDVMRVEDPDRLEYRAALTEGGELELPQLGLRQSKARESSGADLARQTLETIRRVTGLAALEPDDDGDITLNYGCVTVMVQLPKGTSNVRLVSPLLDKVEATPPLLARLNELNLQGPHARFCLARDCVLALAELSAQPFVAEHLEQAFAGFCAQCDATAKALHEEFGGELRDDTSAAPTVH